MSDVKEVTFSVRTTEEFLTDAGLTTDDVLQAAQHLGTIFGTKYTQFFPLRIETTDIRRVVETSTLLKKVSALRGFSRHTRLYSKTNIDDHLFTVRVAAWFLAEGFNVELEPEGIPGAKGPDLCCVDHEGRRVYVECKRIRPEKFYDEEGKKKLADLIYDEVRTCDQIDVFLESENGYDALAECIKDPHFVSEIYRIGASAEFSRMDIPGKFHVQVHQRPPIIGTEDDFVPVRFTGFMVHGPEQIRLPGYTYQRGGRSIGVYGPPPDYSSIWNKKRSKSKKQAIDRYPLAVVICGNDVLGNPQDHANFFEHAWLTDNNPQCSAIVLFYEATLSGRTEGSVFFSQRATHPLPPGYLDALPAPSPTRPSEDG